MGAQQIRQRAKADLDARVASALPPGEELEFAAQATVKAPAWVLPSMLVGLLLGVLPGLVLAVVYSKMTKHYLLALTGTSVYILKVFNPREVVAIYPVGSLPISRVEPGGPSTTVHLTLPDRPSPVRFVIPLLEPRDLDRLIAASTSPGDAAR